MILVLATIKIQVKQSNHFINITDQVCLHQEFKEIVSLQLKSIEMQQRKFSKRSAE